MQIPLKKLALAATCLGLIGAAQADEFPARPLRLVVGFPPGGGADTVARIYGEGLAHQLGQPVVIDNRPGAGTTIAADIVARAAPDGYTLYIGAASLFGGDKALYKSVKYQPADFSAITRINVTPLLLAVNKDSGIKTVQDLIQKARTAPGSLNYASSGNGVITHLAGVLFAKTAGIDITHIPYKGGAPAAQAVASGDSQLIFGTPASLRPAIQTGRVVGLAVTSKKRSAALPEYPTVSESGVPDYTLENWYGLFAPAGVPQVVLDRLFAASAKVLADPTIKKKLTANGDDAAPSTSQKEFREFALKEGQLAADLVLQSGASID